MPRQEDNLKVRDPPALQFDARNNVSGDVPTLELAAGRKVTLRKPECVAQTPDLWSNDVARFLHCGGFDTAKVALPQTCFVLDATQNAERPPLKT